MIIQKKIEFSNIIKLQDKIFKTYDSFIFMLSNY